MQEEIAIVALDGAAAHAAVDELAAVLVDCVDGGASVSFMAPLSVDEARQFWRRTADDVAVGRTALVVARLDGVVVGTTLVHPAPQPNQPHRADIAKVLVHRRARRRGLAAALMAAAEAAALELGRTLLVLDTVEGGDAERLYERLGWQRVGAIPDYALFPDGRLCATVVFYKRLAGADASAGVTSPAPPRSGP